MRFTFCFVALLLMGCSTHTARSVASTSGEEANLKAAFEGAKLARQKLVQAGQLQSQAKQLFDEALELKMYDLDSRSFLTLVNGLTKSENCDIQLETKYFPQIHYIVGKINGRTVGLQKTGSGEGAVMAVKSYNEHETSLEFFSDGKAPGYYVLTSGSYSPNNKLRFTESMHLVSIQLDGVTYCQ